MKGNSLRRLLFFAFLLALLAGVVFLSSLTANWHYVVPVKTGEVAYVAAFDGLQDEWDTFEGRLRARIVDTGVLRLEVGDFMSLPFVVAQPHFRDLDLRIEATQVEGPIDGGYGVIFRLQNKGNAAPGDDSFYMFLVSTDGYYRVVRSVDGVQKELSVWIPSPIVQAGLGAVNRLRVVAEGDQFRFEVNGQAVLLCIPDDPTAVSTYDERSGECRGGQMRDVLVDDTIRSGQIGVAAQSFNESGVVVEFDNLVVLGP